MKLIPTIHLLIGKRNNKIKPENNWGLGPIPNPQSPFYKRKYAKNI